VLGLLKVIENDTIQSGTHAFLLTFHIVTIGLSLTVSEINGDFRRQSPFSHPRVFNATAEEVPLRIGYRRRVRRN